MMILIKLMNDEGHSDNISDETDDNDNDDVLSIFISSVPSVMKTTIFQLHMNVVDGVWDNSGFDWRLPAVQPWLQFRVQGAAEDIIDPGRLDRYDYNKICKILSFS